MIKNRASVAKATEASDDKRAGTKELVCKALFRAVVTKRPAAGLIHHSDRGSQYFSHDYQKLLKQFKMEPSMSRKGNCYYNAPMESFGEP
jgi:putative transposase